MIEEDSVAAMALIRSHSSLYVIICCWIDVFDCKGYFYASSNSKNCRGVIGKFHD